MSAPVRRGAAGTKRLEDFIARADELIDLATRVLSTEHATGYPGRHGVSAQEYAELRTAALSFIEMTFGAQHSYYVEFSRLTHQSWHYNALQARGILDAIRGELRGGWMTSSRALISAEVFADFIEMAEHFLGHGFKDAAAVMIGGVLEEHLRQLARAAGVPTEDERDGVSRPRRAEALNADLRKAEVYELLDQKNVTGWLELRNRAAHADYDAYVHAQVEQMLSGVREFVARVRP